MRHWVILSLVFLLWLSCLIYNLPAALEATAQFLGF